MVIDARMKVEVFKVVDRKPVKFKDFEVDAKNVSHAKKVARAVLEADGVYVRALNRNAENGVLIVYVEDKRPDARERGKPVVHTGPVGKGRQIRNRRVHR